jgi:GMC oxidoreductase/FAD dependent oxidoreductase
LDFDNDWACPMLTQSPESCPKMADVVIVGSGAVGLLMALRLVAMGRTVTVIESGRASLDAGYRQGNRGLVSGRPYKGLEEGRYRGLGGTTRLWGGQLMRQSEALLAPVPELGKPGWPIDPQEFKHWEDQALGLLGVEAAIARTAEAWADKVVVSPLLGLDLELALSTWLPRPDFTQLFGADIARPNGPAILLAHEAIGLASDPASGRVTGVIVDGPGGRTTLHGREVVLACGTLENIRVLLRAQKRLPQSPLATNRHVGRWFFDHLHGSVGTIRPRDARMMERFFDTHYGLAGLKVSTKLRLSNDALQKQAMAACAVTVTGAVSAGEALREIGGLARRIASPRSSGGGSPLSGLNNRLRLLVPLVWKFLRYQRSGTFMTGQANVGMEVEQLPCADSFAALEAGVPAEQARLNVHWQLDGREMEAVTAMCQRFDRWCRATGYAELSYDPRIDRLDPSVFELFHDSSHHMGGARMARSVDDGVVDPDLGVFGMPGLSVAGAAVFPSGGFANPTLGAMALGLRLAERLARLTA